MLTTETFSIVVPAFNAAAFVGESMTSVLDQSAADWRLIVVDDGSRDGTRKIIGGFSDPRIEVVHQDNAGPAMARNLGLSLCRGEMVMFLDADDRLHPRALERLGAALARDPGATVAYGNAARIDESGRRTGHRGRPLFGRRPSGEVLRTLMVHNFVRCPGAALIRADALGVGGGFKPRIALGEDWELLCRMAALGRFVFVDGEPVVDYRSHGHSLSAGLRGDAMPLWAAIDELYGEPGLRARFTAADLGRLRRRREASALTWLATECLRRDDWRWARDHSLGTLRRRPSNVRGLFLLALAMMGWCPRPLRRFL